MPQWRTPTTGTFFRGNAAGDVPTWNGIEWVALPGAAVLPPLSRELFVDGGTSVPVAAQDGSIGAPFSSIAAAIAAAIPLPAGPVVIHITAGTYAENVALPPRDGLTLQGSGIGTTIILGQAGGAALEWSPTAIEGAGILSFSCADLLIIAAAGERAIDFVSVTVAPDTMLAQGAIFSDVSVDSAVGNRFERIGQVLVTGFSNWGGAGVSTTIVSTCSGFFVEEEAGVDGLDVTWNQAMAGGVPGLGRDTVEVRGRIRSGVILRGQPHFVASEDSEIDDGALINAIEGIGLSTDALPLAPQIELHGIVSGPVVLPYPDLAVGGAVCDLDRGQFFSTVSVSVTAGATRLGALGRRGAAFVSTVTAGNLTDLDIRDSQFGQANLAVAGSGTIDRSQHRIFAFAITGGAAADAVTIAPPLPAGAAYVVTYEGDSTAAGALAITAHTSSGFTATGGFGAENANFLVTR